MLEQLHKQRKNQMETKECSHPQGKFIRCKDGASFYVCVDCTEEYLEYEDTGCGG